MNSSLSLAKLGCDKGKSVSGLQSNEVKDAIEQVKLKLNQCKPSIIGVVSRRFSYGKECLIDMIFSISYPLTLEIELFLLEQGIFRIFLAYCLWICLLIEWTACSSLSIPLVVFDIALTENEINKVIESMRISLCFTDEKDRAGIIQTEVFLQI